MSNLALVLEEPGSLQRRKPVQTETRVEPQLHPPTSTRNPPNPACTLHVGYLVYLHTLVTLDAPFAPTQLSPQPTSVHPDPPQSNPARGPGPPPRGGGGGGAAPT